MSSIDIAPSDTQPSSRSLARRAASAPGRVTGKLALALKRIIELGEELDQAAKAVGMTTHALRVALERPHVIQWMKAQRDVFRAYVCAQNIHYARRMRNESGNAMASLGAMKLIEQLSDDNVANAGAKQAPGMVVVVVQQPAVTAHDRVIEAKPLITHDTGRDI